MVPGNQITLVTTQMGKRLQRPSCDFDISTPLETFVSDEYNDLHDPHLVHYFKQNSSLLKHLIKMGYCTENGEIICSLKKYNLYRQYLKRLSIDLTNKKYKEQYEQEHNKQVEEKIKAIELRRNDPENPITLKIKAAIQKRAEVDQNRQEQFKTSFEKKKKRADARSQNMKAEQEERRLRQLQMEEDRQKRTQIMRVKEQKQQQQIQELVLKKHYEDQKRLYDNYKKY